jgi:hypothetical protein
VITVVSEDATGTVILRDERSEGAYILLECRRFSPDDGTGGAGVAVLPETETFPMLRPALRALDRITSDRQKRLWRVSTRRASRVGGARSRRPFELEVDISALPAGELHFDMTRFAEAAARFASEGKVRISPDNAFEWGFSGTDESPPPQAVAG